MIQLTPESSRSKSSPGQAIDGLARANPDSLDLLLILSPFDRFEGYLCPAKPLNGLKVAAFVHDAVLFLFQEHYLSDPRLASAMYGNLERLRQYDLVFTGSETTRGDFLKLLGLPERQIVNVSFDVEPDFFRPDRSERATDFSSRILADLGIDRPYVLNVTRTMDGHDRENRFGVIDAFHRLPEPLRSAHKLVLSSLDDDPIVARLRDFADERRVAEHLVFTGEMSEILLGTLYQRCAAFASPARYEGLSLTLLQALRADAAVLAGNNSSQAEVVGEAGLLANPNEPADISAKLAKILGDFELADELRSKAFEQSRRFDWRTTARRIVAAFEASPSPSFPQRPGNRRNHGERPRIAVLSPFLPKASGISDYVNALIDHLKIDYEIDLFHDTGYVPEPALDSSDFGSHDYRLFDRRASVLNYSAVLYQMGNSFYHQFIYNIMQRHGGIVTLHDFCLAGFHYWCSQQQEDATEYFRKQIEEFDPVRAPEILDKLPEWARMTGGIPTAFAENGLYLNRSVFKSAETVVCHSPWCREEVARLFPEYLEKTSVIPLGSKAETITAERRRSIRARFELPATALIFGSFGLLLSDKMNREAIEAYAMIADEFPTSLFLFVGQDWENGTSRLKAEELGVAGRVRFLGRQSAKDYVDLTAAIDIGVGLRRPPTHGETSAALLDLLRIGVPTIVTDVATFSGYPDTVVRKVNWQDQGLEGLRVAFRELASQPALREVLGRAARTYVERHHSWERAASMYGALIERVRASRFSQPTGSIHRGRTPPRDSARATSVRNPIGT